MGFGDHDLSSTITFCIMLKMCFSHKNFFLFCLQNLKRETEAVIIILFIFCFYMVIAAFYPLAD